MADDTPSLKRDSTMAVTSQEGQAYLESHGFTASEGDAKTRGQKTQSPPKVARQTTMLATAKEGEKFIGDGEHGRTRAQTRARLSGGGNESPEKAPSMKRAGTMAATAKEGQAYLEREGATGGRTRQAASASTEQKEDSVDETSENGAPSMKRSSTMAATAKEGQAFLESQGREAMSRTRQGDVHGDDSDANDDEVAALKRTSTMAATAQEAQVLLGSSAPEGSTRAETAALNAVMGKRPHDQESGGGDAKRAKETAV